LTYNCTVGLITLKKQKSKGFVSNLGLTFINEGNSKEITLPQESK